MIMDSGLKLPSGNYGNTKESIDKFIARAYEVNKPTLDKYIIGGISKKRFTNRIRSIMEEYGIDKKEAVLKYGRTETFLTKSERAWQNIRNVWAKQNLTRKMAAQLGALGGVTDDDIVWDDSTKRYEVTLKSGRVFWFKFTEETYDTINGTPTWGFV